MCRMTLFRFSQSGVSVTWFVNTKEDVADFKLIIRDHLTSALLLERVLPYNSRSDTLFNVPLSQVRHRFTSLKITSSHLHLKF